MSDQNVCPYCGWECVEIVGRPYSGIGRGRCPNCQSNGPEVSPPSAAIDAFCHPAHLLADLHIYDPSTHVVVSRAAGSGLKDAVEISVDVLTADIDEDSPQSIEVTSRRDFINVCGNELRAALEVGR